MTISEVAKLAGVSKATVSRVINNSGYVRADTRHRIEEIINQYQYTPAASAVSLSKKETSTIGVIVPEIHNVVYADMLRGITEEADKNDLSVILFDTRNDLKREARALQTLEQHWVRGMIIGPSADYSCSREGLEIHRRLTEMNIPTVILDRDFDNMAWDAVIYENYQSSYAAALELAKAGNRRMGIITGDMDLKIARDRCRGFIDGARFAGIEVQERDIIYGDFTRMRAYELARMMFQRGDYPEAIFTSNNLTSLGLFKAAREFGIEIGRDIAVIGNDFVHEFDYLSIPFSTVRRDNSEMGRRAVQMLIDRLENPDKPRSIAMVPFVTDLQGTEKRS